jgi:hypothetical protein
MWIVWIAAAIIGLGLIAEWIEKYNLGGVLGFCVGIPVGGWLLAITFGTMGLVIGLLLLILAAVSERD